MGLSPTGVTKKAIATATAFFVTPWDSGTGLRPNTIEPELPLYGSLAVFYEPVVGLAEVVIAKEAVIG